MFNGSLLMTVSPQSRRVHSWYAQQIVLLYTRQVLQWWCIFIADAAAIESSKENNFQHMHHCCASDFVATIHDWSTYFHQCLASKKWACDMHLFAVSDLNLVSSGMFSFASSIALALWNMGVSHNTPCEERIYDICCTQTLLGFWKLHNRILRLSAFPLACIIALHR